MALQFGRGICGYLATAEAREWLVTNGVGGYACGTIAGVLSRHYHGLLIAALKPPLERTLLLTKLDEAVTYQTDTYQLHCDRWSNNTVAPMGNIYLEQFVLEGTIPAWSYAFQDALLVKRIWMEQGQNTTYINYCLKRASAPVRLSLKALVNYRNHHHSTQGQDWQMHVAALSSGLPAPKDTPLQSESVKFSQADTTQFDSSAAESSQTSGATFLTGVEITAFEGALPFYVVSDRGTCIPHHKWYQGYDLAIEQYRGIDPTDDHLHAATFEVELTVGDSITLVATTEDPDRIRFAGALKRQRTHEQQLLGHWYSARYLSASEAPLWMEQLVLAADQFVVSRAVEGETDGKTVIAGYPWFGDWGRDTMIALPGLAIATGRPDIAGPILRTFAQYVDQGMLPNVFPEAGTTPDYNTVDATLWYFEAIRIYHCVSHDCLLIEELFPVLADIIRWHQKGTRYNIRLDADGLITAGEAGSQLTWMDAKVGDWVVTPRHGKPIEINALWYNALLTMAKFSDLLGVSGNCYREMAAHTRIGFQRYWSDELGYCYDVLDGPEGNDATLRPNQIFAVAFPASHCCRPGLGMRPNSTYLMGTPLLEVAQQKAVVDITAQQLLTSYGLRSLSPTHPDYRDRYGGNPVERDGSYHQGTVWGWLIGPFVQAHWQVYQDASVASSFLTPFAEHLWSGCIGTLSEIFDGDPPFHPRGAFAQAWTVAEVLRAWLHLQNAAGS